MEKEVCTFVSGWPRGNTSRLRWALVWLASLVLNTTADYVVDFEGTGETKTTYDEGIVTLSGREWNLTDALIGAAAGDVKHGARAARIRNLGALTMLEDKPDGIGEIRMVYARSNFSGDRTGEAPVFVVEVSIDEGDAWTQAGAETSLDNVDALTEFVATLNVAGDARIRIRQTAGDTGKRWNVDDLTLTDYPAVPVPAFSLMPSNLSGFDYVAGAGPSPSQSYTLSGTHLEGAGGVTVSASEPFEISMSADGEFGDLLTLPYANGRITGQPVTLHVRLSAGLDAGAYAGQITHAGGGVETPPALSLSGGVQPPLPALSALNQPYVQDFAIFSNAAALPSGWLLDDAYGYQGAFGTGTAGGLRGDGALGFQLTGTAPNDAFAAELRLVNATGTTIDQLEIAYKGKVARVEQPGTPAWRVALNGVELPTLAYATADGVDALRRVTVNDLNVATGEVITIAWQTTSAGTSGTRRQIGISDVSVAATDAPAIVLSTHALAAFATEAGTPSAPRVFTVRGIRLTGELTLTAPDEFALATMAEGPFSASLALPTDAGQIPETDIFVRLNGATRGTFAGTIDITSEGVDPVTVAVEGSVTLGAPQTLEPKRIGCHQFVARWTAVPQASGYRLDVFDVDPEAAQPLFSETFCGFLGAGFTTNPVPGQLDSTVWRVEGVCAESMAFGDTRTNACARGVSAGGVSTGGIYAFNVGGENSNHALGIQPTADVFTPGAIILRLHNATGRPLTGLEIGYAIYVHNDQDRASTFYFAHGSNDLQYVAEPTLNYTSPTDRDTPPTWQRVDRTIRLDRLGIAPEAFYYLRWNSADAGGSGSRDELALDDVVVGARFPPRYLAGYQDKPVDARMCRVGNLQPATTYYYRVRAVADDETGPDSDLREVITDRYPRGTRIAVP